MMHPVDTYTCAWGPCERARVGSQCECACMGLVHACMETERAWGPGVSERAWPSASVHAWPSACLRGDPASERAWGPGACMETKQAWGPGASKRAWAWCMHAWAWCVHAWAQCVCACIPSPNIPLRRSSLAKNPRTKLSTGSIPRDTAAETGPHSFTHTIDRRNFDPRCSCSSTCITYSTRITDTSPCSSRKQSSSRAKFAIPESASSKYRYPSTVYIP